MITHRKTRPDP